MSGFKPNVSVSMLLKRDNKIFLVRRFNTGYQDGKYDFPAGHIEKNETLVEAVIRETLEEAGVKVNSEDISFVACIDKVKSVEYLNFLFMTNKFEGEPKLIEEDQSDDAKWFELGDIKDEYTIDVKQFLEIYYNKTTFKNFN